MCRCRHRADCKQNIAPRIPRSQPDEQMHARQREASRPCHRPDDGYPTHARTRLAFHCRQDQSGPATSGYLNYFANHILSCVESFGTAACQRKGHCRCLVRDFQNSCRIRIRAALGRIANSNWKRDGLCAVADWTRSRTSCGHGQFTDWTRAWIGRVSGHRVDATRTEPRLSRGHSSTARGCCSDVARHQRRILRGNRVGHLAGHLVVIVWTFARYSADTVRTLRALPPCFWQGDGV